MRLGSVLTVAVAALLACACSSTTAAPGSPVPDTPSVLRTQVSHILTMASNIKAGAVGSSCPIVINGGQTTTSPCTTFGSSTAPFAKGLDRAANELEALRFSSVDQNSASILIANLRKAASDYRVGESQGGLSAAGIQGMRALLTEMPALVAAAKHLRQVLGLPNDPDGEFVQQLP
jgi:hypothetical protein